MASLSSLNPFGGPSGVVKADTGFVDDLRGRWADTPVWMVRPHAQTDDGFKRAEELLSGLHEPRAQFGGIRNVSEPVAFELQYSDDEELLYPRLVAGSAERHDFLGRRLDSYYGTSEHREADSSFITVYPGQYVAGTTLQLRKPGVAERLRPIANFRFEKDSKAFDTDPFRSIGREMVGGSREPDCEVLVQSVVKPAVHDARWKRCNWWSGIDGAIDGMSGDEYSEGIDWSAIGKELIEPLEEAAMSERQRERRQRQKERERRQEREQDKSRYTVGRTEDGRSHEPVSRSPEATFLDSQREMRGHHLCIRILAVSDDAETARRRVKNIASMYSEFDSSTFGQGFVPERLSSKGVYQLAQSAASRSYRDHGMVFSTDTLAGPCRIPTATGLREFDASLATMGKGVPPHTPRFDFEAAGVSPTASQEEKQVAMLDGSEPGDPFWLGWGRKHGTEVGVYEEYLNAHLLFTGGTRKGKTTNMTAFSSQVFDRDYGALVIAKGKEDDDERFIEEWPEDRPEEDFVFVDTGDEFDKRVRFNLLEVPTDAPPGSTAFESAVDMLAEDWAASFAEAGGGSSNYWGPLMDRITRTVVKGLAKSGKTCTPLDIAAAVSSSEGLEQFRQWMDGERIHFVREAAHRIAQKEDADLEPLAGRMDMLTQHGGLRDFMCARNPSASIQEIVREGKICVVRIDSNFSKSATRFMLTPLARRFYTAKRTQSGSPLFYNIWDEFDKGISPKTNAHEMLSIAGGEGFRMAVSIQAPSNQVYDKLRHALHNQVDTAVSFGTRGKDARYIKEFHSFDSTDNLTDIGRRKFWFKTYYQSPTDEDTTYSYLVDAFPPCRETRGEVRGEESSIDVKAMKRRSVERYGDVPPSAIELKDESPFYGVQLGADGGQDSSETPGFELTEELAECVYRAVYDCCLEAGDEPVVDESENGGVTFETWAERVRERIDPPVCDASEFAFQELKDRLVSGGDLIETVDGENTARYRAGDDAVAEILLQGTASSAGKELHRNLVRRMYRLLVGRVGLDAEVIEQGGSDSLPEVNAEPRFELPTNSVAARRAKSALERQQPLAWLLTKGAPLAVEVECSTGEKDPAQTAANLLGAVSEDRRCLFVVPEGEDGDAFDARARNVYRTATDPERVGDVPQELWSLMIMPRDESEEPMMYRETNDEAEMRPLSAFAGD